MRTVIRNERGIALAIAMFALVIVGALVAGSFFIGTQEQRMGEGTRSWQRTFAQAEGEAYEELRVWDPQVHNLRGQYPSDSLLISRGTSRGVVYKLNRGTYVIQMTAYDTLGGAQHRGSRQRVAAIARIRPLKIDMKASLTTQGSVKLSGNAAVDGTDHTPNGTWATCAAPDTNKAGVRMAPGGSVTTSGNASVQGVPPVVSDPSVSANTFNVFGDVTYADLAARAQIHLIGDQNLRTEPVVTGGVCNKTVLTNWGDGVNRASPCGSYFPIIHVAGNLRLNNVQGQGMLLVDGDLDVQGSYEWFGVVIIKGSLKTAGGGSTDAHFWGMVMAQNVDVELQNLSGKATLNYSKCAILQVLDATGVAALARSRGFAVLN